MNAEAAEEPPTETPVVAPPATTQSSPATDVDAISEARGVDDVSAAAEEDEEHCCKFCYDDADSQLTLVTPCACRGTSSRVHLECLKSWHEYERFPEEPRCGLCGEHYTGGYCALLRPTQSFTELMRALDYDWPPDLVCVALLTRRGGD